MRALQAGRVRPAAGPAHAPAHGPHMCGPWDVAHVRHRASCRGVRLRAGRRTRAARTADIPSTTCLDLPACDALREPMAHPTELDALYALVAAAVLTALLTPLTMRFARAVGAIDEPRERGLSERPTPLL